MTTVLEYLRKVEGDKIHRNNSESDITSPFGIYKAEHKDAEIFKYIDSVAVQLGIVAPSSQWNKALIERIDEACDKNAIYKLAAEFYEEYLEGAHLELFPNECKIAMMSMYTNSPKGAWKSVQRAIRDLVQMDKIGLLRNEVSIDDGFYGAKTKRALEYVNDKIDPMYFETLMLFHMLSYYVELWAYDPDRYGKYLLGWKNRMSKLTKS